MTRAGERDDQGIFDGEAGGLPGWCVDLPVRNLWEVVFS